MNRNVLLLALCQALMLTGTSLLLSASPLVGARLAGTPPLPTLPLALQCRGMMMSSFTASILMRHIGRQAGLIGGLVLALCGAWLCAVSIYSGNFLGFCAG